MILKVYWDGLWTLSFGLSQSRGHGSWLVCEVALSVTTKVHMEHGILLFTIGARELQAYLLFMAMKGNY